MKLGLQCFNVNKEGRMYTNQSIAEFLTAICNDYGKDDKGNRHLGSKGSQLFEKYINGSNNMGITNESMMYIQKTSTNDLVQELIDYNQITYTSIKPRYEGDDKKWVQVYREELVMLLLQDAGVEVIDIQMLTRYETNFIYPKYYNMESAKVRKEVTELPLFKPVQQREVILKSSIYDEDYPTPMEYIEWRKKHDKAFKPRKSGTTILKCPDWVQDGYWLYKEEYARRISAGEPTGANEMRNAVLAWVYNGNCAYSSICNEIKYRKVEIK